MELIGQLIEGLLYFGEGGALVDAQDEVGVCEGGEEVFGADQQRSGEDGSPDH